MTRIQKSAVDIGAEIRAGRYSAVEAVQHSIRQIREKDSEIHAFLTLDEEHALQKAEQIQKLIASGELAGPLAGVPIAVKDNICTKGLRTTCASRMLENYIPSYQAEVIRRLEAAGMIVIGKTNMDEFAMGSTTETSYFGPTIHPFHKTRVPGGSSGGSCAAVASGMVAAALGSDTGGSIRQPSAHCGSVGLKPTYGLVSRYGLIAYCSSMDQIGPIANSAADCAALLDIIAGYDDKDSTSIPHTERIYDDNWHPNVRGLKVGIPAEYLADGLQSEIRDAISQTAEKLRHAGAEVQTCSLSHVQEAVPAYYILACAEASSNLARFDGVKYGYRTEAYQNLEELYVRSRTEGFGSEVKKRILLGTYVLSEGYYEDYYLQAVRSRNKIASEFQKLFEAYDILLAPVTPTTAPELGSSAQDPMQMYLADVYTVPANLCGLPAISIPIGEDNNGMPIGMQLIGRKCSEKILLQAAEAVLRNQ